MCQLQVYSKVIELYLCMFFFRFFSLTGTKIMNTALSNYLKDCLFMNAEI